MSATAAVDDATALVEFEEKRHTGTTPATGPGLGDGSGFALFVAQGNHFFLTDKSKDGLGFCTIQGFGNMPAVKGYQMMNPEKIWLDGFKLGEELVKDCPYEKDSEESKVWLSGWLEGAAKKSGSPYSRTLEEKLQGIEHKP